MPFFYSCYFVTWCVSLKQNKTSKNGENNSHGISLSPSLSLPLSLSLSLCYPQSISLVLYITYTFRHTVLLRKISYIPYYIKVTMCIYLFVSKDYSSYSSQCRKLKICMSNGYKILHVIKYFMRLYSKY